MSKRKYSKYEKARIVGARALQVSMGAPIIIEIPKNVIDPLRIALVEFENGAIPMTVKKRSRTK
ncbi:MAG: DNA-directed RNA polymerase subunit K [Candidatus Thermoplasmatota archaeon]|jgi:DNA-directed RNA polymerase subunit K|nr:DNA-directed RNA polymerase subunit K [Candidatus Thermoplasmatota archaeon]MCL5873724.1 DNA-directed RNA polymerase subunit K [Candidatus Thermoplasmatota archaeon]